MLTVLLVAAILVVTTTFVHYEVLAYLNWRLPALRMGARLKVALVILCAFLAHAIEIAVYGGAYFASARWLGLGTLNGSPSLDIFSYLYFSAEAFTSLGFGDLTPSGPARLLAGVEALNGLLLIAWSASFTYLGMERFWADGATRQRASRR